LHRVLELPRPGRLILVLLALLDELQFRGDQLETDFLPVLVRVVADVGLSVDLGLVAVEDFDALEHLPLPALHDLADAERVARGIQKHDLLQVIFEFTWQFGLALLLQQRALLGLHRLLHKLEGNYELPLDLYESSRLVQDGD